MHTATRRAGLTALLIAAACASAGATQTYHVHPAGGDPSACSGRSSAPAENGNRDCAWSHPFIALPPGGSARMASGDTLVIHPGTYRMGLGAPGAKGCSADWPWDCYMPPVPSGSGPERPTRIIGADCSRPAQLVGVGRAARIINLDGSSDVEIRCLEITDAAVCAEHHCHGGRCPEAPQACPREGKGPFQWAAVGIDARDAARVLLADLHIHGLAVAGVRAGRIRDWRVERVRIRANGWSGWDGDIGDDSANAGRLEFTDVEISDNGCLEAAEGTTPTGCWAQQTGGYGDGLGTGATAGEWVFERVTVTGNTSDGIDLLYLRPPGSVTIRDSRFGGNAGNQIKVSGPAQISGSEIDGRCDRHENVGQMLAGDLCRAGGDALVFSLGSGDEVAVRDSRITGNGDCLVVTHGGDPTSKLALLDNELEGLASRAARGRRTCGVYLHAGAASKIIRDNLFIGVRETRCRAGNRCRPGRG